MKHHDSSVTLSSSLVFLSIVIMFAASVGWVIRCVRHGEIGMLQYSVVEQSAKDDPAVRSLVIDMLSDGKISRTEFWKIELKVKSMRAFRLLQELKDVDKGR